MLTEQESEHSYQYAQGTNLILHWEPCTSLYNYRSGSNGMYHRNRDCQPVFAWENYGDIDFDIDESNQSIKYHNAFHNDEANAADELKIEGDKEENNSDTEVIDENLHANLGVYQSCIHNEGKATNTGRQGKVAPRQKYQSLTLWNIDITNWPCISLDQT